MFSFLVCKIRCHIFLRNIKHATIFFVSNRHSIFLRLGYDIFHMCHSMIPYVCVHSSYRSLSGACFIYAMKIVPPQDGRYAAS